MSLGNIVSTMFSENGPKAKEQKREDESRKNVVSKYERKIEINEKWEVTEIDDKDNFLKME